MTSSKRYYKEKIVGWKEEKAEEPEAPKYRDRAKDHREDQNPDYEPTELGSIHTVAPLGTVDLRSIAPTRFPLKITSTLEVMWLVKGLDYALLNKVRSEIDKKLHSEEDAEGKSR